MSTVMQTQCPNCGGYENHTTAFDYLDPVSKSKVDTYSGLMVLAKIILAGIVIGVCGGAADPRPVQEYGEATGVEEMGG